MNDYVHIEAADLRRPNARFTTERQGYQVLTPFGKLGYSQNSDPVRLEFDVRGFDERIGLVADTCNWSVDPTVPPPPPRPQNPAIRLVTEALVGDAYGESDLEVIPNPKGDGVFIYVPASKSEGRTMLWLVIDDTVYALTRDTRNMTDNNLWLVMAPLNRWERTGLRSGVANDAVEIVFGR